jgi:hypothetical protein
MKCDKEEDRGEKIDTRDEEREYVANEKIRSVCENKGAGPPTIVSVGSQPWRGVPNLTGSCQSQIPMPAMSDRWKDPMMSTGA